ncbi:methyltransferase domain-containing protein [Alteromonas sp. H39]|uniref:methyltransferase domain-containing protein n=1 Tax=Alteromonas sp. H39 TaxID=3389876 RepID=UPI0039E14963
MISRITCEAPYVHTADQQFDTIVNDTFENKKGVVFIVDENNSLLGGVFKSQLLKACRSGGPLSLEAVMAPVNITASTSQAEEEINRLFSASVQVLPLLDGKVLHSLAVPTPHARAQRLNLNVGAGGYSIPGFVNLDYPSDWYQSQQQQPFVSYDMRGDDLPYADNTVDNIYCSHVIEHIETSHVIHFLQEAARVLKHQGVLRIACPDADFLKQVSSFENDFWTFRKSWFENHAERKGQVSQADFYVREIATRRSRFLRSGEQQCSLSGKQFLRQNTESLVAQLCSGLTFDKQRPGDHINGWWYERIQAIAEKLPFTHCIRSRFNGSVSGAMQGSDIDQTYPQMSLYVDLVK